MISIRRHAAGTIPIPSLLLALLIFALISASLPTRDIDLDVYWKAAQRVYQLDQDPYPRQAADKLPFTYPPSALFLISPLGLLDRQDATRLFWWVNLALLPLLMLLLVQDLAHTALPTPPSRLGRDPALGPDPLGGPGRRLLSWGPLYIALFGGIYLNLIFYQINFLILLCIWLYWRRIRLQRLDQGAGAALALGSVAKPHYALLMLGALLQGSGRGGAGAWRAPLLGALAAGGLILALSLVLAPPGSWQSWWSLVPGQTSYTELPPGHSSIAAPWNRSIPGQVARCFVPNKFSDLLLDSPRLAAWLSTALVLLLTAISARVLYRSYARSRRAAFDPVRVDLQLAILSAAIFLAAPASWTHHLVMLLPACLILLRDGVLDPREPRSSRLTAALVLLAIACTFDDLIARDLRMGSQAIMGLMTVAVVALWLLLLQRLWRLDQSPPPAPPSA